MPTSGPSGHSRLLPVVPTEAVGGSPRALKPRLAQASVKPRCQPCQSAPALQDQQIGRALLKFVCVSSRRWRLAGTLPIILEVRLRPGGAGRTAGIVARGPEARQKLASTHVSGCSPGARPPCVRARAAPPHFTTFLALVDMHPQALDRAAAASFHPLAGCRLAAPQPPGPGFESPRRVGGGTASLRAPAADKHLKEAAHDGRGAAAPCGPLPAARPRPAGAPRRARAVCGR